METQKHRLQLLKLGYAHLLDVSVRAFDRPGFVPAVTRRRGAQDWADWVTHVWLVSLDGTVVCSVSPDLAEPILAFFQARPHTSLLDPGFLDEARAVAGHGHWSQMPLFTYLKTTPPRVATPHRVARLAPGDPHCSHVFRHFDGDVYAVRDREGHILSHAGIKNRGIVQEIGVWTREDQRGKGMGKAVVAQAASEILARGLVPVYTPDRADNRPSFALIHALGFEQVGEMLLLEERLPDWQGYGWDP